MEHRAPHKGVITQTKRDKLIAKEGPSKNSFLSPALGVTTSLVNNLIASLKGCANPTNLTLLGPLRN